MSRVGGQAGVRAGGFPYVRGDESLVVIAEELGQVFSLRARG